MTHDAPKPEENLSPEVPSIDGEAAKESEKISSPPTEDKVAKVKFNGREYDSLEDAEKGTKELQTAYQKEKAERERLEVLVSKEDEVKDEDFMNILFGEDTPAPAPQVPPTPAPAPQVDRDKMRVSLLLAERDPKKPHFKVVANDVAKLLTADPIIMAVAGIGQSDKAVDLAYSKAVAGRLDSLKAAEYTRGREEALREKAKPDLAGADAPVVPPPAKKPESEMTVEELEAILPHAEPR